MPFSGQLSLPGSHRIQARLGPWKWTTLLTLRLVRLPRRGLWDLPATDAWWAGSIVVILHFHRRAPAYFHSWAVIFLFCNPRLGLQADRGALSAAWYS